MPHVSHELEQLPNGSQLCFVNIEDAEVVRMQVEFARAGHLYSPEGYYETAHLTEHMIFAGSKGYPDRREFEEAISGNGASVGANTHMDRMEYHLITPAYEATHAARAYLGAIDSPLFEEEALRSEREVVRTEIMTKIAKVVLWGLVNKALGLPTDDMLERLDTLDDITTEQLRQHHQQTHTFDTMTTIVTGNLSDTDKGSFVDILQDMSLGSTANTVQIAPEPRQAKRMIKRVIPAASGLSYWLSSYNVASFTVEDTTAHEVAYNLLYAYPRSTIETAARDQGLIYGIEGGWTAGLQGGYDFMIGGAVSAANAPRLCKLVRTAIAGALDLNDETTLEKVKRYTVGSRQLRMQNMQNIHDDAAEQLRRFGAITSPAQMQDALHRLDAPTFRDAVRRGLTGGTTVGVQIGEEAAIRNRTVAHEFQKTFDYLAGL